ALPGEARRREARSSCRRACACSAMPDEPFGIFSDWLHCSGVGAMVSFFRRRRQGRAPRRRIQQEISGVRLPDRSRGDEDLSKQTVVSMRWGRLAALTLALVLAVSAGALAQTRVVIG